MEQYDVKFPRFKTKIVKKANIPIVRTSKHEIKKLPSVRRELFGKIFSMAYVEKKNHIITHDKDLDFTLSPQSPTLGIFSTKNHSTSLISMRLFKIAYTVSPDTDLIPVFRMIFFRCVMTVCTDI